MGPFTYLDSSGRDEAARVREFIDRMLAGYPEPHRAALENRLRLDTDDHEAAFFELFVHALLRARGFELLAIEPSVPGSRKCPDFLFRTPSGQVFYLEAVTATGVSEAERGRIKHRDDIRRAIESVRHPNYWLGLHESSHPSAPVPTSRLRLEIERWVSSLPAPTSAEKASRRPREHLRRFSLGRSESVVVSAFPRFSTGALKRGLGVISHGVRIEADASDVIRKKVEKKANRYGRDLPHPLLVAVNCVMDHIDWSDIEDAAFGSIAMEVTHSALGYSERIVRLPEAIFRGPPNPMRTRLAAVVAFERALPWRSAQCKACVITNPWAALPLDLSASGVPLVTLQRGRLSTSGGESPGRLLGLPDFWPE